MRRAVTRFLALLSLFSGVAVLAQEDKPSSCEAILAPENKPNVDPIGPIPVNPKLCDHSKWFEPEHVYNLRLKPDRHPLADFPADLNYDAYSAVGFDLADTIVLKGPTGELVVIDTLGNPKSARAAIDAMRALGYLPPGPLPIRAIIYTHNHIDHTFGNRGYLSQADKPTCPPEDPATAGRDDFYDVDKENCVAVIGQEQINDGVGTTATVTGTIIDARSLYMYGVAIPLHRINDGIGPEEKGSGRQPDDQPSYRMPSRTFTNKLHIKAAGLDMELLYVPSETNDELSVFVPDGRNRKAGPKQDGWGGPGLLMSAEVIQGPSFPNLYSLRGTSYRNPANWFRSVDKLRDYDAWCMVPSHGPPLCETDNIQRLMRTFRDAIQFTHDQTIRWIDKGYTMDQLSPLIESLYLEPGGEHARIEAELAKVVPVKPDVDPLDYLRPFYGSIPQSVREIYAGSVGWFEADPTFLRPLPPKEAATRYVKLMGGSKAVNDEATAALAKGEPEWAAELVTNVIRALDGTSDPEFTRAKDIKYDGFKQLAALEMNPNWRNWYITSMRELRGLALPTKIDGGLVAPGVIAGLPAGVWVNSLTMRLKAGETARNNVNRSLGFWFPAPADQSFGALGYVLHVRDGIAEFVDQTPQGANLSQQDVAAADVAVSMEKATLDWLLFHESSFATEKECIDSITGKADPPIRMLHGTIDEFAGAFCGWFDPKPVAVPKLTIGELPPD